MGRGVSSGGGQSSLGYLFGTNEAPPPPKPAAHNGEPAQKPIQAPAAESGKQIQPPAAESGKQIPAGVPAKTSNNYFRADGQNSGNFLTDRPSTKVHSAPGGGSSLGYLFGDGGPGGN